MICRFYARPKSRLFNIPKSMFSLNLSYEQSFPHRGKDKILSQVLAIGKSLSLVKAIRGFGVKPRGGTRSVPVAKISSSSSVLAAVPSKNDKK